jgi:N-hydroxyarylamine O-acetyltransferase
MTLLVQMDQRWLADVGFGDSFNEPLLLDSREVQVQRAGDFQLIDDEDKLILRRGEHAGDWKNQYRFSLRPYQYPDYEEMCRFQETSPESHFTKGRMCSLARPDGRITLSELKLITTTDGEKEEQMLSDEQEFNALLASEFGISERLNFRTDRV